MALTARGPLGRYGGVTGEQRRSRRREQLIEAGLEVFGTTGYAASSVKGLCAQAGLTERYFYESFRDREDLLFAVYEHVVEQLLATTLAAAEAAETSVEARARAGLRTWFHAATDDIRVARVMSFEVVGVSERLERRRRQTMHAFAAYLVQSTLAVTGEQPAPRLDPQLAAMSVVGATNELLIEWVLGTVPHSVDEIVDHCVRLYVATATAAIGA